MGKKRLNHIKKKTVAVFVLLLLFSMLPLLPSCNSDYRKALEASGDNSASAQNNNTGKETADETQGDTSETTSESESTETEPQAAGNNGSNQQIIEVTARSGGYYPENIEAKAGVATTLTINSKNAYGCERAFTIPDLNISEILPENGQTSFDLGIQPKGTKLVGVCSMGMYYFVIVFS